VSDLVKCYRCQAQYRPGNWVLCRDLEKGTGPRRLHAVSDINPCHCPICLQPPQTEPTPPMMAM
jgi:hypothetical protein